MLNFFCPCCDCEQNLEEVMVDVAVATTICSLDPGSEPEYGEQSNEGGRIDRFQCQGCGFIIRQDGGAVLTDYDSLEEWLKKHRPKLTDSISHGQICLKLADSFADLTGPDMVREWNSRFDRKIRYLGDSLYEFVEESK